MRLPRVERPPEPARDEDYSRYRRSVARYVADDAKQAAASVELLVDAAVVAVSLQSLCEFAWVLARHYQTSQRDISDAIRALLNTENVVLNRPAVEAGLSVLDAGGDFADGVIAYDGNWLGGETFVSFDKKAVSLLSGQGRSARLLA